jgi:exo-1,4-beta-D-glucosaminidase
LIAEDDDLWLCRLRGADGCRVSRKAGGFPQFEAPEPLVWSANLGQPLRSKPYIGGWSVLAIHANEGVREMVKAARLLVLVSMLNVPGPSALGGPPEQSGAFMLHDGWMIQSSRNAPERGEVLSTPAFKPWNWYPAVVPTTVLAALVDDKVYEDPYIGMNLRSIPGTTYPIGDNISWYQMPPESPFLSSWWYRDEFRLPPQFRQRAVSLHLDGVNFRANIWLNGKQIGDAKDVAGSYRVFEFNVSGLVKPDAPNVLAVEVFPPQPDDLAITWVDVNPSPADKDMGLWQDVYLTASGPVSLRHPQVLSHLDLPSFENAHLTVTALLHNTTATVVKGTLKGEIEKVSFQQEVSLEPQETRLVTFTPEKFPQLNLSHPRVWWPWQLGDAELYEMQMAFESQREVSDSACTSFGIREVTSEITDKGYRVFKVNGKRIQARGAGWWSDMLLRSSPERQEAELRYFRDMHLNVLRMDGKFENAHFLDLADKYGLLLMPGWCCCDHWEQWSSWKPEDYTISVESLRDRIRSFRNHPSILCWLNGDDNPPPENVAQMYVSVLKAENWPNPYLASATEKPAAVTGPTGLKMTGPYQWVPPAYWLTDTEHGGAIGFLTETSPGPAIPPLASLRKFIPPEHLWPIDEYWNYHAGGSIGVFADIKVFTEALNARYGEAKSAQDFSMKAQAMDYDGQRAMYEAYGRNKYNATGVLQEMLNNAWPSLIWQLYDYYLRPAGGYFGTKKALEPLHIQYSYDDRSIAVVNSLYREFKGLRATARVYNFDLTEKFSNNVKLDVPEDGVVRAFAIPEISGLSTTYFVSLALDDAVGHRLSTNLYWLSTKPDVLAWDKAEWYYTPTKSFADLTALQGLPPVDLQLTASHESPGRGHSRESEKPNAREMVTHITVENPSSNLAFMVHLQVNKGKDGEEVLPILWEDNYFSLLPGEKREVAAIYKAKDLGDAAPVVQVDGWNIRSKLAF